MPATQSTARDLPAIAPTVDEAVRTPLTRQREELQRLLGFAGDGLDSAVTWRHLRDGGWASLLDVWRRGGTAPGTLTPPATGGGTTAPDEPDLTPPPDPTGLNATGGLTYVTVTWDAPVYTQGHGHGRTLIYGVQRPVGDASPPPVFGDAAVVWTVEGPSTITAFPSDPNVRWHLWIKWVSVDGVPSVNPDGGLNGEIAETGQDVTQLLNILSGEITESQLYGALVARINLIDGASSVPGSVNARIASEASLRVAGDAGTLTTAQTYTQTWAYSKATVDSALSTLGSTITANYTAADGATLTSAQSYVNTYAYSRATVDSALSTLSSTLTANYTAADGAVYSSAVATSATAIAGLDGAVHALYTVRVQTTAGGRIVVGGFGLAATPAAAGGTEIEFGVRADRFYVGAVSTAAGISDVVPFIVQTAPTTINGVSVPAGVYMDTAMIRNGTIVNAKIGDAAIDDAKVANLSAAKLTVGDGTVGGNLKSTTYVAGSGPTPGAGWLLQPSGAAFFQNATVYGTIYAASGVFGGSLAAATGTFSGSLSAATGTFAGNLAAASGSFVGSVSVSGRTWSSGNGIWLGMDGGHARAVIGSSTQYLSYDASTGQLLLKLDTFTASFSPVEILYYSGTSGAGSRNETITVTPSGGVGPYTYTWSVLTENTFGGTGTLSLLSSSGNTATVRGTWSSSTGGVYGRGLVQIVDANGRSITAFITLGFSGISGP